MKRELFFESGISKELLNQGYDALARELRGGDVGYYLLPESIENREVIHSFCKSYDLEKIKNVVVIGIGGSSLGTKAIDYMLSHTKNRNDKNLIFMENVDPNEIERNMRDVLFEESIFIMISKSGSTIETTSSVKYLMSKYQLSFEMEKFQQHFICITDKGSPLDAFASDFNLKTFYLPLNVGGRFSVFSAVGLLPLAILGYDIDAMLDGAYELKKSFFDRRENSLVEKAYHYAINDDIMPINVLFSYTSSFKYFNDWYVQLWGESLGKYNRDKERVGLTPIGIVGSVDQHSFLQLVIEGPINKSMTMIKLKDFDNDLTIPNISIPHLEKTDYINNNKFSTLINAQCDATMQSIMEQGIDVDRIEIDRLSEKSVGEMIFYYELLTSLTGHFLDVNTYDQPGVELGKVILKESFEKEIA